MPAGDTIAAVATGLAQSPLAIVRVSGPDAPSLARDLLGIASFDRRCARASVSISGHALPVVCLLSPAPASFTGEHVLEIILPGNPILCERLIEAMGVRHAGPGEFSARAHLNGRLSLVQAEGVAALISAESQDDLDAAGLLLSGARGATYHAWTESLATLLALVEAGIDFADQEDVVAIENTELRTSLEALRRDLAGDLAASAGTESRTHHPSVALVGPPSAGKSTLFNALLRVTRSVVDESHHTTRDAIREPLDLSDVAPGVGPVDLIDLPGLHEKATPSGPTREAIASADLRLWCDPTGRFAGEVRAPCLRVRTKADLPTDADASDVRVCALDGYQLDTLRRAIADHAFARSTRSVPARHRAAFAVAIPAIDRAIELTETHPEAELIASALRDALDALGSLTGEITPDDVIGRVFASFCVGK